MQIVRIVKNYKGYEKDSIISVENNEAHALIDGGYAKLYKEIKVMDLESPKKSKTYRIK